MNIEMNNPIIVAIDDTYCGLMGNTFFTISVIMRITGTAQIESQTFVRIIGNSVITLCPSNQYLYKFRT
ncbi:hypothetical protein [Psychrobacillus sp. PGGUH221]|uniref:hypothetical protein n=1 Tax=Psychrobacillus sp. PGGUH221 TaxID=3020058 RepID=UPI0035C7494B